MPYLLWLHLGHCRPEAPSSLPAGLDPEEPEGDVSGGDQPKNRGHLLSLLRETGRPGVGVVRGVTGVRNVIRE